MLPPTVKQFFFKLLISIFVHDYKNVLRQYRQAYTCLLYTSDAADEL